MSNVWGERSSEAIAGKRLEQHDCDTKTLGMKAFK